MKYRVVAINREGEIWRTPKKFRDLSIKEATAKRNSYQAFLDHQYPDLGAYAKILPMNVDPPAKEDLYNVYDSIGRWMGLYDDDRSELLVTQNEDWTRRII